MTRSGNEREAVNSIQLQLRLLPRRLAVIRTSLALISFGFTIFQFFERLRDQNMISSGGGSERRFGVTLVALGIAMLIFGIVYHIQYMIELRRLRHSMREERLVHAETICPASLTLITAFLLLAASPRS